MNITAAGLRAHLTRPTGQVQISLEEKPLFVSSDAIEFLGPEASRTIGDGARWRHPFPQNWAWPPQEPSSINMSEPAPGRQHAAVNETPFVETYQAKPSLELQQSAQQVEMFSQLENLSDEPQQAWIVAPFAMPAGHRPEAPRALAAFPADAAELEALPDSPLEHPRWIEDLGQGLIFVNPGGQKSAEQPEKLLLPDRWSVFAREGDSSVVVMPPTGSGDDEAFQVYAGFDNYVELEWAGAPVPAHSTSSVRTRFEAVPLDGLDLNGWQRFGESGQGLQAELAQVVRALELPPA